MIPHPYEKHFRLTCRERVTGQSQKSIQKNINIKNQDNKILFAMLSRLH